MSPDATAPEYGTVLRESRLPQPPTQARGAEKRERIYEAAIARYGAEGVAATRVEDVIAEAGVSWATFFRYFPRKEDVLIEAAARHFHDHIRPVASRGIGDRRLRVRTVTARTLEAVLTPAEMTPALHTEAVLEVFARPARFAAIVDSGHPQPIIGVLTELIDEAQRRGEVRADVDAGAAAVTVTAGALFPAVQAASVGADPLPSLRLALEIVWTGVAQRGPAQGARGSSLT
jgi:AcrR family transcriptional regulator